MKRTIESYTAPEVEVLDQEPQEVIATSGDFDKYNNEDYNWQ